MSFRINLHAAAGALLVLLASTLTFAQSEPVIKRVTVNLGTNQMEITGSNFENSAKVTLGGQTLRLINTTPTSIEAELPSLEAGSHRLVLTGGNSPINDTASLDMPSLTQDFEEPALSSDPTVVGPVAPPPAGSLVLSGWSNYSYNCPSYSNCWINQYTPGGAQLVAGGCGSLYDATSVQMVNASPTSNISWNCTVFNNDLVNGHTIVSWIQWGTYTGSSAPKTAQQQGPSVLVIRPLSAASAR